MPKYVEVYVDEVIKETEKAVLIEVDGEEHWLPFSQMEDEAALEEGDVDTQVTVTEWWANKNNVETL